MPSRPTFIVAASLKGVNPAARRFTADQRHISVIEKVVKASHGIGAAADAGENRIRQPPLFLCDLLFDFL